MAVKIKKLNIKCKFEDKCKDFGEKCKHCKYNELKSYYVPKNKS